MARTPLRRTSSSPHLRRCGERRRWPSRVGSRPGRTERPSRYEAVSPRTIPSHAASHAAQSGSAPACAHQPAPRSASSSGSGRTSVERTAPKMINAAYTGAKVDRNPKYHGPGVRRRPLAHQRSEEHTSELQSRLHLVCRLLLEKKKKYEKQYYHRLAI